MCKIVNKDTSASQLPVLLELEALLQARKDADPKQSYAALMHTKGVDAILKKLGEETFETVLASRNLHADSKTRPAFVHEVADMLFHLLLLLAHQDVKLEEIFSELKVRQGLSGLAEKAARKTAGDKQAAG